ncbi:Ppx/GppA phosphatase family protein [soil metagenome]
MKLAAIDIGSNSIKTIVVDAVSAESFTVLARGKESVRLGHGTLANRQLSPEAIDRAIDTMRRFRLLADSRGAEKVYAVATATVRVADNAAKFIETVETETGVHIEVLSGIEEARLIGLAAVYALKSNSLLNIDIGGGSTELSVMQDGLPVKLFSMKLGAVGLTDKFIENDPPKAREISSMQAEIALALERPTRELREIDWHETSGTSGTILALGGLLGNGNGNDKTEKGGQFIELAALEKLNEKLALMNVRERRELTGVSNQRAEIIIAGGQILAGVMQALKIKKLSTCNFALREGVVIDRLQKLEISLHPPVSDLHDPRLLGVLTLGKRFGYEKEHSLQVARLSEKIFDEVAPQNNLPASLRVLLSAAAILHDIGYYISHEDHHKHSLYLIKHTELIGFSEEEREIIGNITRYHRGSLPKPKHLEFSALSENTREVVRKLGGILRLADALDRSYDSRVNNIKCNTENRTLLIKLESDKSCEREILAAAQKGEMFETAFDLKLEIWSEQPA